MSILIPIGDFLVPSATVEGVIAGGTDLSGVLDIRKGFKGALVGSTTMKGDFGMEGDLIGSTVLDGFLRINDEPNIFLTGELIGDTNLEGVPQASIGGSANFHSETLMDGVLSVTHPADMEITILVNILDASYQDFASQFIRRYDVRFLVDGVQVPIRAATLEAPSSTLGTELRIVLAEPDAARVSFTASIDFQIGIWSAGAFHYTTMLAGGKLSARQNPVKNEAGRPADVVSLSIIDIIADRWNRAPRNPIHLYDPTFVSAPDQSAIASERILVYRNGYIFPVNISFVNLRMYDVIHYAYVIGTGFSSIVTNIPNFPVWEVDFTLSGGYDAGVRELLSPFSPLYFERNNVLYIIDPDAELPLGFVPRDFPDYLIKDLSDDVPQTEPINAILVQMRNGVGGEYKTERVEQDPATLSGTFGVPGYTETTCEKRIAEWRNFSAPEIIIREEVMEEFTRVVDFEFNVIETTKLIQHYDVLGRKIGHSRHIGKLVPDIDAAFADPVVQGARQIPTRFMDDVIVQEQKINYRPNPLDPSQDVQDTVTTVEKGMVIVDPAFEFLNRRPDAPFKIPITEAVISGFIDAENEDQSIENADIRTCTESLRCHGQQISTEIRIINHLANVSTQSSISTRPGGIVIDRKRQQAQQTVLLTIPGTEATGRRTPVMNTGNLPEVIAIELGFRKLRQLNSPPKDLVLNPAYVDLLLTRGIILTSHARNNVSLGNYMITGWSITFEEDPQRGMVGSQGIKLRQLTT